jgi:hypothetical protein
VPITFGTPHFYSEKETSSACAVVMSRLGWAKNELALTFMKIESERNGEAL